MRLRKKINGRFLNNKKLFDYEMKFCYICKVKQWSERVWNLEWNTDSNEENKEKNEIETKSSHDLGLLINVANVGEDTIG